MSVGIQHRSEIQLFLCNPFIERLLFSCITACGINNYSFLIVVVNDKGIYLERIENKFFNMKHNCNY